MPPTAGVTFSFRPAVHADHLIANEAWNRMFPDEAHGPEGLAHGWSLADPEAHVERFVIEGGGAPLGIAFHEHPSWEKAPDRYGRVQVWLPPEQWASAYATAIAFAETRARAEGTRTIVTSVREDQPALKEILTGCGYIERRRSRSWELDLVAGRERLMEARAESSRRMREAGFTVTTWDTLNDPAKFPKLHALMEESIQDVPTTAPHFMEPLDTFRAWIEDSPLVRPDRIWVALRGVTIVGVSWLEYPVAYGNVWTDYTGTARSVRGRGVARALKHESVVQAIGLGVRRVRTNNDADNAPILKLNAEMGYTRIPGWIQLHRAAGTP